MTTPTAKESYVSVRGHSYMTPEEYHHHWSDRILRVHRRVTPSGCWEWTSYTKNNGYGEINYKGKNHRIHRLMWELLHGVKLDRWMYVCHRCDNRLCFRPSHLFIGTPRDNTMDSVRKGRHQEVARTECLRGHPFSPENTSIGTNGSRHCKTCVRGRLRRKAGWPEHLWYADIIVPPGYAIDRETGSVVPAKRKAA